MILRKPYAFFIKYFKLIHIIMTVFMGILVLQTNSFLTFFNQYINSNILVIGRDLVSEILFKFVYIYIILVVVIDIIIWILLDFKNKKKGFYIFNFFCYVLLLAFYIYIRSILGSMAEEIVDIRLIMVLRDFAIIAFTVQVLSVFVTITRAIGLNIKQFDFESDLKDLNISSSDNEEFEVNVDLDSEKVRQKLKTVTRNFKYYLKENIRIIIPIVIACIVALSISIYYNVRGNIKTYSENVYFNIPNYSLKIEDSFYTKKDYRLLDIAEDKTLVGIRINVKTTNKTSQLTFSQFALHIGNNKYYPTIKYTDSLKDLGETYIKQKLTDEYKTYLLVYEIPSSLADKNKKIVYITQLSSGILTKDKKIEVNLKTKNLDVKQDNVSLASNTDVNIDNFLLDNITMNLKDVAVGKIFKINYDYCVTGNQCYQLYEPLQPSFSGSKDKALIKINLSLSGSSIFSNNISKFIVMYTAVDYKINGVPKTFYLQSEKKPSRVKKDHNYYYDIPAEILNSDDVTLKIQLRGTSYIYKIK